jgi:hypothetical protein
MVAPAVSKHLDCASIRGNQPFADFNRRGFSGTVGTKQTEALSTLDLKIEAVHCNDVCE